MRAFAVPLSLSSLLLGAICVSTLICGLQARADEDFSAYDQWARSYGLPAELAGPDANPDNDRFPNGLEFAFGTDPLTPDSPASLAPRVEVGEEKSTFVYSLSSSAVPHVEVRALESADLKNWRTLKSQVSESRDGEGNTVYAHEVPAKRDRFYSLEVRVLSMLGDSVITIGTNVGEGYWVGLTPIASVDILTEPPATSADDPSPNYTKYPKAVGAGRGAVTPGLAAEYAADPTRRLPLRSWMGWFLWGDGEPPPGINPGIFDTEAGYGEYDGSGWDFFNFQWQSTEQPEDGSWSPIRLDQQPLYLGPLVVNYNWAPGMFGYVSQPLSNFPLNTFYWKDKKIVRGVNIGGTVPYFYQYGDYRPSSPEAWRQTWMYLAMRPLETTVIVPGNLSPTEVLEEGEWNKLEANTYSPFPYPVWDKTKQAAEQTPFAILTDRIGDFDADIVWEATNSRAASYEQDRYQRTAFGEPGVGNYMKMTVAQGSPFVWCETNNARYASFYNLIRANTPDHIDNNDLTGAGILQSGPYSVPGVNGVKFVLLYGNHVNPNQWVQEAEPFFATLGGGPQDDGMPGGFNPPATPYKTSTGTTITPQGQSNHMYTAVFFLQDSVKPVTVGEFGTSAGTDNQGNPYFFLEFRDTGKNWFVLGAVPAMRYYRSDVSEDSEADRKAAAIKWAEEMGKYAFNFPTDSKVSYSSKNMFRVDTEFQLTLANPLKVAGVSGGAKSSIEGKTVLALKPHHYQPIRLGPDLSAKQRPQVMWEQLDRQGISDFPKPELENANKNFAGDTSRWDYWGLRGNHKSIIGSGFSTRQPFQNFLPTMPAPDYEQEIDQTGIAAVNITNVGTGYEKITETPEVIITDTRTGETLGSGAQAIARVNVFTGKVDQVDVTSPGNGYPDGNPSPNVEVTITAPSAAGGTQATAYAQVGGGKVLAIFMTDKGAGYSSTITVSQENNPNITPPIIVPRFDPATGDLLPGPAIVYENGAGFDFTKPIQIELFGTGTGAELEYVPPSRILNVTAARGGVTSAGRYAGDGSGPPDLVASFPPPDGGGTPQAGRVNMVANVDDYFPVLADKGVFSSAPSASFTDDLGNVVELNVIFDEGSGTIIAIDKKGAAKVSDVYDVVFTGGNPTTPAVGKVFPVYNVGGVDAVSPLVEGYNQSVQVNVLGGSFSGFDGITIPDIQFRIPASGIIGGDDVQLADPGEGLKYNFDFEIAGGRGFSAILVPIINDKGTIIDVIVLDGGTNYLPDGEVYAFIDNGANQPTSAAELRVNISDDTRRTITSVEILDGGEGYTNALVLKLTSAPPPWSVPPDFVLLDNPKGVPARFTAQVAGGQVSGVTKFGIPPGKTDMRYINATKESFEAPTSATVDSGPAFIWWSSNTPFARFTSPAEGFLANPAPASTEVGQVLYSSISSQFTTLAQQSVAPFGGAFFGNSAPDGYGLGGQLGGLGRFIGDMFSLNQTLGATPDLTPSSYAVNDALGAISSFTAPIFQEHTPIITTEGALQTAIQGLQQTVTYLFQNPPSSNSPADMSPNIWDMDYFTQYDDGVGRVVINPTATQPASGITSSIQNPPAIPDSENDDKEGLSVWRPGLLWSGFGVSDEWNDQHYFYGYYISAAALAGIFDQAWSSDPAASKPAASWADPTQMGTAIDQLVLTLAHNPDNQALNSELYTNANFTYQKLSYFDQWNGHAWATGSPTGSTTAVLNFGADQRGYWGRFGNLSDKFNGENENSIFEGVQAWSATILWGGATDRKAMVDHGMYLYTTSLAAADAYFLDKNYNQANLPSNKYSWVPNTTIDAELVQKSGSNLWPSGTDYAAGAPEAYTVAPEFFADENGVNISPGQSLMRKPENTLNNFFYDFPIGSKFIQAYPPTAWTMGMVRDSDYMKKWAGVMMRQEWNDARDSALFQPADWLATAMTSALAGVPYNPGDVPYPLQGSSDTPSLPTYTERLWSSWVTESARAGSQASLTPPLLSTSVLTFLLSLEEHGTPDWTYIGRATNANGKDDDDTIVFTAVFSKEQDDGSVVTRLFAFNPGYETRYAAFHRLNPDGSIQRNPVGGNKPLEVAPKKMAMRELTIQPK